MSDVSTIYQCFACNRQHDGMGGLLTHRLVVPVLRDCGRADCAEVCERLLQQEAERRARVAVWRRVKPPIAANKREFRKVQGSPLRAQEQRKPYVDPEDHERVMEQGTRATVASAVSPVGQSATDFGTSANGVLLAFFKRSENFNKPFLSSDLEDLTRAAGHPSTRMNNRAIWLREQLLPGGLYIDNDPTGATWGLARGSWYRVCFIEDATSLTEAEKHALQVKCGLRADSQGSFEC